MSIFYKGINTSSINSSTVLTIGDKSGGVNISSTNLTGTNAVITNIFADNATLPSISINLGSIDAEGLSQENALPDNITANSILTGNSLYLTRKNETNEITSTTTVESNKYSCSDLITSEFTEITPIGMTVTGENIATINSDKLRCEQTINLFTELTKDGIESTNGDYNAVIGAMEIRMIDDDAKQGLFIDSERLTYRDGKLGGVPPSTRSTEIDREKVLIKNLETQENTMVSAPGISFTNGGDNITLNSSKLVCSNSLSLQSTNGMFVNTLGTMFLSSNTDSINSADYLNAGSDSLNINTGTTSGNTKIGSATSSTDIHLLTSSGMATLQNTNLVNSSATNFSATNGSLRNAYLLDTNAVNMSVTNFSATNASCTTGQFTTLGTTTVNATAPTSSMTLGTNVIAGGSITMGSDSGTLLLQGGTLNISGTSLNLNTTRGTTNLGSSATTTNLVGILNVNNTTFETITIGNTGGGTLNIRNPLMNIGSGTVGATNVDGLNLNLNTTAGRTNLGNNTGTVNISGTSVNLNNVAGNTTIGNNTGTVNISGLVLNLNNVAGNTTLGNSGGTLTLNGTTTLNAPLIVSTINNTGNTNLGNNTGTVNISGVALNLNSVAGNTNMGNSAGTVNISGTALNLNSVAGSGTITIGRTTGSSTIINSPSISVGTTTAGSVANVTGATVNVNTASGATNIGNNTGIINISGSSMNLNSTGGNTTIGNSGGTLSLNGTTTANNGILTNVINPITNATSLTVGSTTTGTNGVNIGNTAGGNSHNIYGTLQINRTVNNGMYVGNGASIIQLDGAITTNGTTIMCGTSGNMTLGRTSGGSATIQSPAVSMGINAAGSTTTLLGETINMNTTSGNTNLGNNTGSVNISGLALNLNSVAGNTTIGNSGGTTTLNGTTTCTNGTITNSYLVNSNLVNASATNFSATNTSLTNAYLVNSNLVNASVTNFSATNASLTNAYLMNGNALNMFATNFSSTNTNLANITSISSNAINFSATNSSFQNIYVGNIFSLTGASYSLTGSGGSMANTSYIAYDNNISSMSLVAKSIQIQTNNLAVGDTINDSTIASSDVVLNVLNSFGLKVNANNVLILDTSGNTTVGNSNSQTNVNSSTLLLSGSTLQATTNGYNILTGDQQNNTTLGNSIGSVTLNGTSAKCNPKFEIPNVSGLNASYLNVYVGNLFSLTGTAYALSGSGGSATNTSYITYLNNTSDMNISANNLTINSSTYIQQNLQVFGNVKANAFQATSDQRVKMNIEDLNRVTSLETLRKLKPKMYDFVDCPKNQLGFIAQEIKNIDLLKSSIHEGPGFIPNIYRTVLCEQGWFTVETPLKKGDAIRYKRNGKINTTHILNASSPNYQLVEPFTEELFLYGSEVPDFHSIEKDMIFTLAVSAIQQLDTVVTEQQDAIQKLIDKSEEQQKTLDAQQKTIDLLLQKIDAILVP